MARPGPRRSAQTEVTDLLLAWADGRQDALDRLMPLVFTELRRIARNRLKGERAHHTLQPTALVNEAYLRLVDLTRMHWRNREQFFAIAARMMRAVLVDAARQTRALKRGGGDVRVTLDADLLPAKGNGTDLVALNDALVALAAHDARKGQVVELRFFGGLSVEETARVLDVSTDTVTRDWNFAKAWLRRELSE